MDQSPRIGLPFLLPNQAQKHVTLNEALGHLDVLVQLSVEGRELAVPPSEPQPGDCWLVAEGATGVWAGHDDDIAIWRDGTWAFHTSQTGWLAFVRDEAKLVVWNDAAWADAVAMQNLGFLGSALSRMPRCPSRQDWERRSGRRNTKPKAAMGTCATR